MFVFVSRGPINPNLTILKKLSTIVLTSNRLNVTIYNVR